MKNTLVRLLVVIRYLAAGRKHLKESGHTALQLIFYIRPTLNREIKDNIPTVRMET